MWRPSLGVALLLLGCPTDPEVNEPPDKMPPSGATCAAEDRDPNRITLHRLNRAEYNNTLRDLIGDQTGPADDFPPDDFGYGFDNIADVLSVSPLLFEKHEIAVQNAVEAAVGTTGSEPTSMVFEAETLGGTVGNASGEAWNLYSNGTVTADLTITAPGTYELSARAWSTPAGPEDAQMEFLIDGTRVQLFDVPNTAANPEVFRHRVDLTAGDHTFGVGFTNDFYDPPADRNLLVDWLQTEGPYDAGPANPALHAQIVLCDPDADGRTPCLTTILQTFARRAWRRPVTGEEVTRLIALADLVQGEGDEFDVQVAICLEAILLSPHYLYRVELDPDPLDGTPHALTDHELAARLSYFLWSTMPDERLAMLADAGQLSNSETLAAEVKRMIADPKADALVENFVGQWMSTRALDDVNPDYLSFPDWDDDLKTAMGEETELFMKEMLRSNRSALDMIESDFTYLNDRLAQHYGLPEPGSAEMVRVDLDGPQRVGVLTHGSFLTVTSHPRRTSPVKRGKFVLEHMLCTTAPPPPPEVEAFPEPVDPQASLRERFEQHRSDSACQPCHTLMDPIGFALENFDGIGSWREDDDGFAIDASGELVTGEAFDGPAQLSRVVKNHPNLPSCLTKKLMTYGLGRGVVPKDDCYVADVTAAATAEGYSLESLLVAMTRSGNFTMRRGEPE